MRQDYSMYLCYALPAPSQPFPSLEDCKIVAGEEGRSGRCGTTGDAGRRAGAKGVGGGGARREKQDQCHSPGIALLWFGLTYK